MAARAIVLSTLDNIASASYQTRRRVLLCMAIFLAITPSLVDFLHGGSRSVDLCFINRELEQPYPTIIPLRDGILHDLSVLFMWTAMFTVSLLPHQRSLALFQLTYASLWFHATYILLAALKALLMDYNCAGRHRFFPNGISGHYCYFVFVTLTARRLVQARLRANRHPSAPMARLILVFLYLFVVGAVSTLYRTYFHGYHSPRQILLGIALGSFSHVMLDFVLFPAHEPNSVALMLSAMLAKSLTSIMLYFRWWPVKEAGPAISGQQLVFHTTLWLALLLTGWLLPKPDKKEL